MSSLDIRKLRENKGISQGKLAEMIGVSLRTIQNYEKGGVVPQSKYAILRNVLSSSDEASPNTNELIIQQDIEDTNISHGKLIPFYDAEAAAGAEYGMSMEPARQIGVIEIGGLLRDSETALRVYGNSMVPNYPSGCVVGLRRHLDSFIEPGMVFVIETADNRYLKRLFYNKDRTAYRCVSDNHVTFDSGPMKGEYCYPDFEIPFNEIRRLFRVVGVIKRNAI